MAVLTALAIGSVIAGTAIRARAAHKAGTEAQRVAEYQAKQAEFNAEQAREQAVDASRRGEEGEGVHRREVRRLIGTQRAGYAAQGVDVSLGTPRAVGAQAEQLLQSDLGRLRRNAEREALGFKAEADDLTREARFARQSGKYAKSAARWGVASTILGGAAESSLLATRYYGNKPKPTSHPPSSPPSSTPYPPFYPGRF